MQRINKKISTPVAIFIIGVALIGAGFFVMLFLQLQMMKQVDISGPLNEDGTVTNFQSSLTPQEIDSLFDDLSIVAPGFLTNAQKPQLEAIVFADLTEDSLSGRFLTSTIPELQETYGDSIRFWYVHSVLPYRDLAYLTEAIDVTNCIADQDSVWSYMNELVENGGKRAAFYPVGDTAAFEQCLADFTQQEQIKAANQEMMATYGIRGVPMTIFVSPKQKKSLSVIGALSAPELGESVDALLELKE